MHEINPGISDILLPAIIACPTALKVVEGSRHGSDDPVDGGWLDGLRRMPACGMGASVNQVSLIDVVTNV